MIFLITVLVFSLLSNVIQCQTLQEDLVSITTNPLETLQEVENKIISQALFLSQEEREILIEQLENIKKQLCARPAPGILTVPLIATIFFGLKAFFDYQNIKTTGNIFLELIIDRKKAQEAFMFDLCAFIIGACVTLVVNVEYRESVNRLFKKESTLETKINALIHNLKNENVLCNP